MPEPLTPDQQRAIFHDCHPVAKRNALRIAAERYEDAPRGYVDQLADRLEENLCCVLDVLELPTLAEWTAEQGTDQGAELDLERSRGL